MIFTYKRAKYYYSLHMKVSQRLCDLEISAEFILLDKNIELKDSE